MRRHLAATWILLSLAGCTGDAFHGSTDDAALGAPPDGGGALVDDAGAPDAQREATTLEAAPAPVDSATVGDAGDVRGDSASRLADAADSSPDVVGAIDAGELDAGDASADVVDAGGLACDRAYGDASPGGPCCVHVWATPTMGAVLCTVDGSRWCWQTGMPCSALGSRCVTQAGVTYCAP